MSSRQLEGVVEHIRKLASQEEEPADTELLERFIRSRNSAAFTMLVQRHGGMVLSVCRHVLHHEHDAEDACQATFLVLARKAGAIRQRQSLASWLYAVAYRSARRAQEMANKRRNREQQAARAALARADQDITWREMQAIVDEEVSRLPQKFRAPFVLCSVQGKSRSEAARELGWKEGTVAGRLAQARGMLHKRLTRRGVLLSAVLAAGGLTESSSAAVSASLVQRTVQAALRFAGAKGMAGIGSTPALLVARGVLRSMGAGKLVGVLSMLLVGMAGGAGMLAHQATSPERGEQGQTMHARSDSAATALLFSEGRPKVSPAPKDEADGNSSRQSIVAGRVLDAGGKPVAGIEVAVVGGLNTLPRGIYAEEPHDLLATGRTGVDGRIRLRVTHFVPERYWGSVALVAAPGYALAWQRLDFHLEPAEFTLRLAREQVIYGRLVTLEGQPAAGVKVEVSAVDIQPFGAGVANNAISWRKGGKRVPGWPGPATSDAQGRFVLHGIGRNQVANLEIVDDRFAFQAMRVQNGEDPAQVFTAALHPAQLVEGTVTCADTGKPVPGAQLALKFERSGAQQNFPWVPYFEGGQTDAQGRFKINPMPATYVAVAAYPPEGIPYLPVEKPIEPHARSVVRLHADVGLPAGVRVRGRIVDEETQQPVANGTITCTRMQAGNPFYRKDVLSDRSWPTTSGADCTFAITVPPGPCTLLIHGGNEYILQETNSDSLSRGRRGGWKLYAHAIVKLDYKPGDQPTEMTVKLRRGVSIKGRLVGPNGEPVDEAVVITPLQVSPRTSGWQGGAKVRQGTFEVKGCEPGKAYTLHFLEPKRCWGAMVSATAHEPGEPITVRLAPCGSATLRAQDRDGRPRAGWWPALELIMGPGTASLILAQQKGEVAADHTVVSNFDRYHHADLRTDAQGKVTLPALIPGARYELNRMDGSPRVFTVSAGQTLDLGTFTVERD